MKLYLSILLCAVVFSWSIPKPMESVTNYNVLMVHGAYASDKCFDLLTNNYKLTATN